MARCTKNVSDGTFRGHQCRKDALEGSEICAFHTKIEENRAAKAADRRASEAAKQNRQQLMDAKTREINERFYLHAAPNFMGAKYTVSTDTVVVRVEELEQLITALELEWAARGVL